MIAGLATWLEAPRTQAVLIGLILLNAAILGLQTFPGLMDTWGPMLEAADRAILAIFVVEIALRIAAHRTAFFRDAWSVFDFTVIGIALVPASEAFAALRALRVLRIMRVISLVPSMRLVAGGLLSAIPALGSVIGILALIHFVASVIASNLFGERYPEWFGTLAEAAFTMFQIMTLEGWSGIVRSVMETYPFAWLFFIPYILLSTFTMLNLFIAVVVNATQREARLDP